MEQDAPHALLYTTSLTEWGEGGRPAPSTVFCFKPLCLLLCLVIIATIIRVMWTVSSKNFILRVN